MENDYILCCDCGYKIPKDKVIGNDESDTICQDCVKEQYPKIYNMIKEFFYGKDEHGK